MIRPASADDLTALQAIERAAGAPFRALGMDAIADDEPPSLAELTAFQRSGRAWVWADSASDSASDSDTGPPVAYLLVEAIDDAAHIEQVSVDPRAARRGLGAALIDTAADWGRARGLTALTLTTFREVPWNAPYYARLGFTVLADAQLTDGLRRLRAEETARGLDRWPRLAMRRGL